MRYLSILILGLLVFSGNAFATSAQATLDRFWQGMATLAEKMAAAGLIDRDAMEEVGPDTADDEDVVVLDYELLIETLSKKSFLEQLAYSWDDTPHLWRSFPQETLQLGNFLQAQL